MEMENVIFFFVLNILKSGVGAKLKAGVNIMLCAMAPTEGCNLTRGVCFKLPGSVLLESNLDENLLRGIVVFLGIEVLTGCDASGDAIGEKVFTIDFPASGLNFVDGVLPEDTPELLSVFVNLVGAAFRTRLAFLLFISLA
tara:strand:- start:149 stop:571 length:423 start_codon:yes stop_codon:yes gene_type:complete